ncbi:MAG TPA: APC family permease [bacterium]|nr:APC family permease [bacterium]
MESNALITNFRCNINKKLTGKYSKRIQPTRTVGLASGILYGIGCGIGGSIFILLGTAIEAAKSGILISLILGGILIFLTALNYSELSTSLPISGGAYNFSKEALGGFLAFIIGFFLWIANIATFSFSAQAFVVVIDSFFPATLIPPLFLIIVIISILFTAIVVFRTQRLALRTLIILSIILLVLFAIFIFAGLFIAPITNKSRFSPQFLYSEINFLSIISMFSLMFIFFTSITSNVAYLNPDLKNPSKNIPKVNIYAILATLSIYLSISVVVLINIGNNASGLGDSPLLLAEVLFNILGIPGYILMVLAAAISTFIAMNAALGSAVSVLYALARDHYVSNKLTKVSKKRNVPSLVLIITIIIAIIFTLLSIFFANIGFSANIATFIYLIGLAFVNYAAVSLRRKRKELDRPFKAPFFPYLPIIVMSFCLILALFLEPRAIFLGGIIFIIGITYYLITIADRHSIVLTMAGLKVIGIIVIGILIWVLKNFSTLNSPLNGFVLIFDDVLLRILIFICIFTVGTVFLDILPLKELVYFFIRKINKKEVAIDIGIGQIIELKKSKAKLIYYVNMIISAVQMGSSVFIFILVSLFASDIINIDIFFTGVGETTGEYIFNTILIFFGGILLFSGSLSLYRNRETKALGI